VSVLCPVVEVTVPEYNILEVAMKTYAIVTAGLFLASLPAMGQSKGQEVQVDTRHTAVVWSYEDGYIQKAIDNYSMALNSANDGLVESAIAHLTFIRIDLPQRDLKKIERTIGELAEKGRTPVIRYKAYLANLVFESPATFQKVVTTDATDSDLFFSFVGSEVQKTLFGHNMK